jgi:GNAT superfamily N-acetyltransferase
MLHPLLDVQLRAAAGEPPAVDGAAEFVPELGSGRRCVLSFTGHAYLATAQSADEFADLGLDGFGRALQPEVLQRLAGTSRQVGVLDATLVSRGRGGGALPERADLEDHPRVQHARVLREDVQVYGDERGLVTLAHGLAGRLELSIAVSTERQGQGVGASLLADGLRLVPEGEPVFAAVSPGNVRSLRLFLRAGFEPIGSEVIVAPAVPLPAIPR